MDRRATPIRIGVIGAGLIGQVVHLPTIARLVDYELVAVAEPSATVRKALTEKYGQRYSFEHWHDIVECPDIDAVVIASPNALHAPALLAALERGQHCFVEKPLCIDQHALETIQKTAQSSGVVVQVGYNKRFDDVAGRLASDLERQSGRLLCADALTYDPGLARFFPPGALLRSNVDVPEYLKDELEAAEQQQVHAGLGLATISRELRRVFVDIYLGALVHDINLLAWFGEATGSGEMIPLGSQIWPNRAGAHAWGRFSSGAPWTSTWAYAPEANDFRESLRLLLPDGPRELELDGPYGRVKRRGTRYVTRRSGFLERYEDADGSFENELRAFAAAIRAESPERNTIAEAGRDLVLLTELFLMGLETMDLTQ